MAAASVKTRTNANGAGPKRGKAAKAAKTPSPLQSGTATPVSEDAPKLTSARVVRPDKKEYDAEQERLKAKIAEVQEKMVRACLYNTTPF